MYLLCKRCWTVLENIFSNMIMIMIVSHHFKIKTSLTSFRDLRLFSKLCGNKEVGSKVVKRLTIKFSVTYLRALSAEPSFRRIDPVLL